MKVILISINSEWFWGCVYIFIGNDDMDYVWKFI